MHEYLDKVINADQGAKYGDDIVTASHDANHQTKNLKATFECIRKARLEVSMHKCHIGTIEIDILERTITPVGNTPQKRITIFLGNNEILKTQKTPAETPRFPKLLQKLFYKIVRKTSSILRTRQERREGPCEHRASKTYDRN